MEVLMYVLSSDIVNGLKCAMFCGLIAVFWYDLSVVLEEELNKEEDKQ